MATILGMAAVTYAARAGGLWLMARWTPPPAVARALGHTPRAALVAPAVLAGGAGHLLAALVVAAVAVRTKSLLAAVVAGAVAAALLRLPFS
jgi:uncharacterized membrane protein